MKRRISSENFISRFVHPESFRAAEVYHVPRGFAAGATETTDDKQSENQKLADKLSVRVLVAAYMIDLFDHHNSFMC